MWYYVAMTSKDIAVNIIVYATSAASNMTERKRPPDSSHPMVNALSCALPHKDNTFQKVFLFEQ